ncbi:hypothetical protein FZEAL_2501, partial [Fusarium zealandicum]
PNNNTGKWYIIRYEEHDFDFKDNPLKGGAAHLRSKKHGKMASDSATVIDVLGVEVISCDKALADKNNAVARGEMGSRSEYHVAKESSPMVHQDFMADSIEVVAKVATPVSQMDESTGNTPVMGHFSTAKRRNTTSQDAIINPTTGRVYLVYNKASLQRVPGLLLSITDLNAKLQQDLPECYRQERESNRFSWAEVYEDEGPKVSMRRFPFMFLEHSSSRGYSTYGWVTSDDDAVENGPRVRERVSVASESRAEAPVGNLEGIDAQERNIQARAETDPKSSDAARDQQTDTARNLITSPLDKTADTDPVSEKSISQQSMRPEEDGHPLQKIQPDQAVEDYTTRAIPAKTEERVHFNQAVFVPMESRASFTHGSNKYSYIDAPEVSHLQQSQMDYTTPGHDPPGIPAKTQSYTAEEPNAQPTSNESCQSKEYCALELAPGTPLHNSTRPDNARQFVSPSCRQSQASARPSSGPTRPASSMAHQSPKLSRTLPHIRLHHSYTSPASSTQNSGRHVETRFIAQSSLLESDNAWSSASKAATPSYSNHNPGYMITYDEDEWVSQFPFEVSSRLHRMNRKADLVDRSPQLHDFVNTDGYYQCPFCHLVGARAEWFNKHLVTQCCV